MTLSIATGLIWFFTPVWGVLMAKLFAICVSSSLGYVLSRSLVFLPA